MCLCFSQLEFLNNFFLLSTPQERFIEALDPSSTGNYNQKIFSSLATSIFSGKTNIAALLLEKTSLPIDFAGQTGNTGLLFASMFGNVPTVEYLIHKGADVTVQNALGETALALALKNGHRDIVLLLRAAGATK